jgi:flagellar biosynthesis/type III secretory pathway protein FliH
MMAVRARIIRAPGTLDASGRAPERLFALRSSAGQRRRFAREEIEARLAAERIIQEARSQAETIVLRAREQATIAAAEATREAQEQAEASVAAQWLALRAAEATRVDRDIDRIVAVSIALAERLLGAALELDPARVVDLARAVIAEARGARRIAIEAHPLDAEALRKELDHVEGSGLDKLTIEVRPDEALARGELRLQTDMGTIDAKLAPRLERLAPALRDAFR